VLPAGVEVTVFEPPLGGVAGTGVPLGLLLEFVPDVGVPAGPGTVGVPLAIGVPFTTSVVPAGQVPWTDALPPTGVVLPLADAQIAALALTPAACTLAFVWPVVAFAVVLLPVTVPADGLLVAPPPRLLSPTDALTGAPADPEPDTGALTLTLLPAPPVVEPFTLAPVPPGPLTFAVCANAN